MLNHLCDFAERGKKFFLLPLTARSASYSYSYSYRLPLTFTFPGRGGEHLTPILRIAGMHQRGGEAHLCLPLEVFLLVPVSSDLHHLQARKHTS